MADEKHEGWTNKETWLVSLWLNNEERTYNFACSVALAGRANGKADLQIGEMIENVIVESLISDNVNGFTRDLLNAALARVDWKEIGVSFRESVDPEDYDPADDAH